jgi:dipeptidyl aminopeptidase/acylaminoacyl peptidase
LLALPVLATATEQITIEDMLNAEDLDPNWSGSAFSPDGRSLAYTINAVPSQRPTWSYPTAGMQTMARVFVTSGTGAPHEIVGTPELFYSLMGSDAWAPDSSDILLIAAARDAYGLARYDLANGEVTRLPGRIHNTFIPTFAWLPDGRIVYATIPDGAPQGRQDAQVLKDLQAHWDATWSGRSASVTVNSANPVFSDTERKAGSLLLGDPRSGVTQKIADGDYLSLLASPSGHYVAAIASREALPDALDWAGKRGELQIFALVGGKAKPLHALHDTDMAELDKFAWSPSEKKLLVIGRSAGTNTNDTRLYLVDAASGMRRELDTRGLSFEKKSGDIGMYPIGWLGERAVAIAAHEAKGAAGVVESGLSGTSTYEYGQGRNTRTDLFVFGDGQAENLTAFAKGAVNEFVATKNGALLVVIDGALWQLASGKPAKKLTADFAQVLSFGTDGRNPPPRAQTAYYCNGDVERASLLVLTDGKPKRAIFDLKTGSLANLAAEGDVVVSAPDRRTTLMRVNDGWASSFVLDNGTAHPLATVNANLKDKVIASAERFIYTVGKRKLNGFVLWPPDAKKDAKLPAVVTVYGGTVYGEQQPRSSKPAVDMPIFSGQLLAAEGYAVIYASTPLGRGADSDQPAQLAEAVVAAIDALAAGGRIDPRRVGVIGHSYGGFSTAALLAQRSDRFKAGISLAGTYDFLYGWGTRSFQSIFSDQTLGHGMLAAKLQEEGQGQFGKPFWEIPDAYIRNSPIFHVDKLNSPLLMLHGDLDMGSTDLAGAERMYTALVRAGKKPTLVRYWGEGHIAQSASVMRDQWMRITKWLGYYLKASP